MRPVGPKLVSGVINNQHNDTTCSLHQGLVGRLSSGKYFAFHAVAAGLSDRDALEALYVVNVPYLRFKIR